MTALATIIGLAIVCSIASYITGRGDRRTLAGLRAYWRAEHRDEVEATIKAEYDTALIKARAGRTAAEVEAEQLRGELADARAVGEEAISRCGELATVLTHVATIADDWDRFAYLGGATAAKRLRRAVAPRERVSP